MCKDHLSPKPGTLKSCLTLYSFKHVIEFDWLFWEGDQSNVAELECTCKHLCHIVSVLPYHKSAHRGELFHTACVESVKCTAELPNHQNISWLLDSWNNQGMLTLLCSLYSLLRETWLWARGFCPSFKRFIPQPDWVTRVLSLHLVHVMTE